MSVLGNGRALVAVVALVVGACGGSSSKAAGSADSTAVTTVPASAATTTPDGAVPWIPTELTNLAGQPSVTITADPGFSVTSTPGGINDEAVKRQVQMPPGEPAELRVDWEPPVCDAPTTNQTLHVDLADGQGSVSVKVAEPATPHCLQGDAAHGLASSVLAGTFSSGRHADVPATPKLIALTAHATLPATVARGGSFDYEVALTNPTNESIPLDPCPGYVQELFQMGSDTRSGVNSSTLYRLNCVPRPVIEPGETVRFLMHVTMPAAVGPGEFGVTWRIVLAAVGETPVTGGSTTVQ